MIIENTVAARHNAWLHVGENQIYNELFRHSRNRQKCLFRRWLRCIVALYDGYLCVNFIVVTKVFVDITELLA
jgi:hypothetical protein